MEFRIKKYIPKMITSNDDYIPKETIKWKEEKEYEPSELTPEEAFELCKQLAEKLKGTEKGIKLIKQLCPEINSLVYKYIRNVQDEFIMYVGEFTDYLKEEIGR